LKLPILKFYDLFYDINQSISFDNDMILGNGLNPFILSSEHQVGDMIIKDIDITAVYPNPFNPITNIEYIINAPGYVKATIYNIEGKVVKELLYDYIEKGNHNIHWNASHVSSGIYYINFELHNTITTNKIVYIK